MKQKQTKIANGSPPPLVPQSVLGWLAPLGKSAIAALTLAGCLLLQGIGPESLQLADAATRH
jgi:hypothetical protein